MIGQEICFFMKISLPPVVWNQCQVKAYYHTAIAIQNYPCGESLELAHVNLIHAVEFELGSVIAAGSLLHSKSFCIKEIARQTMNWDHVGVSEKAKKPGRR